VIGVMIADFNGDGGDAFAERLVGPLGTLPGMTILRRKEPLRLVGLGSLEDKVVSACERGRAWLQEASAGLLVWGEVSAETRSATLRILPAVAEPEGLIGALNPADSFEIPIDLGGESGRAFAALVLAAACARGTQDGFAIVGLRRMLFELSDPAALPLAGLGAEAVARLWLGLGHAHAIDSRRGGEASRLDSALAYYRAASERLTALAQPKLWAQAMTHFAGALSAKAEAERSSARMGEAVEAYRTVAQALTRIERPSDWALAQARLGAALHSLGQMEGKPTHFRDAATAYQQALTVFTQAAHPIRWSDIMHQYGVLLTALGEHMAGTAALEQAVMVFHKAHDVRRRDVLPLHWAQTASALGSAAFGLAKRNGSASALREAVGCFEGALEIYEQSGQSQAVAVLQRNLQRARRLLETRGDKLADDVGPKGTGSVPPATAGKPAQAASKGNAR
jgi:tetratricopeptide (TPR) repeat protein